MWFLVLPMALLLGMTPYLLANSELTALQQRQAGADWAQRLLAQHRAALAACSLASCTPEEIAAQLPVGVSHAGYGAILRSFHDGTRVVSVLDTQALLQGKGRLADGQLSAAWRQLTQGRAGAGSWRPDSSSIETHKGRTISISPSSDRNFAPGSPAIAG
ncbi:hypothetical protein J9978_21735 [Chromobacterium violaceum]|uniref:hypothetical protein n=1 Tax=Chromobacterium violaceum TaxID=536 RepID=UPI0009DA9C74|nr:hypothetical protein [Chromobacterium violaceum]MBP4052099.1 hypothetical protein [Chromobacterium violaceum]OQS20464.1 hypothetical protein B0T41_21735 [Chromobacterium violaceum]